MYSIYEIAILMKRRSKNIICTILWISILITPFQFCIGQSSWELNLLRNINPQQPNSGTWKALSTTAKPLSVCLMTAALLNKDSDTKQKALEIGGSIFISAASATIFKQMVKRDRPAVKYNDIYPDKPDQGYSFPSGHVSVSFAAAASLSIQYKKWYITLPAYLWSTGVAYSRLYLGQHYPTDVLMGAATGIGSAYLAHWLNKKIFPQKIQKK